MDEWSNNFNLPYGCRLCSLLQGSSTLHYNLLEQPPIFVPHVEVVGKCGDGTGRIAKQGDPARVTTEVGNVLLDPLHGQLLVPQTLVARHLAVAQAEESQRTQPVVHRDQDDAMIHEPGEGMDEGLPNANEAINLVGPWSS